MTTTKLRKQIYEFIEMYVDTTEPKKLCSSIEDLVEELAESKVKNLSLSDVVSTSNCDFCSSEIGTIKKVCHVCIDEMQDRD